MLKVKTSDQLGDLTGARRAKPVEAPAPAPAPPAHAASSPDIDKLAQAVLTIAAQQRDSNAAILRALEQRPRTMEADIVRDEAGRATKVIITVTDGK